MTCATVSVHTVYKVLCKSYINQYYTLYFFIDNVCRCLGHLHSTVFHLYLLNAVFST